MKNTLKANYNKIFAIAYPLLTATSVSLGRLLQLRLYKIFEYNPPRKTTSLLTSLQRIKNPRR